MLDLHYDTLLSDGISGWAVAQGERGKRLCSPCPLVPQRVRESGREEAGRSPCAGRCSGAGLWKTTTEAEMAEKRCFKCLMHIVSMVNERNIPKPQEIRRHSRVDLQLQLDF
ncbi:uncharacterized [Tachysurus ichikawai]